MFLFTELFWKTLLCGLFVLEYYRVYIFLGTFEFFIYWNFFSLCGFLTLFHFFLWFPTWSAFISFTCVLLTLVFNPCVPSLLLCLIILSLTVPLCFFSLRPCVFEQPKLFWPCFFLVFWNLCCLWLLYCELQHQNQRFSLFCPQESSSFGFFAALELNKNIIMLFYCYAANGIIFGEERIMTCLGPRT